MHMTTADCKGLQMRPSAGQPVQQQIERKLSPLAETANKCLEIIIAMGPDARRPISSERLSRLIGLTVSVQTFNGNPALRFAVSGDCRNDLPGSDAAPSAEFWALAPNCLPALKQTIAALGRECKRFYFVARRVSAEQPRQIARISVGALARLVSANRLCGNVLYVVGYHQD